MHIIDIPSSYHHHWMQTRHLFHPKATWGLTSCSCLRTRDVKLLCIISSYLWMYYVHRFEWIQAVSLRRVTRTGPVGLYLQAVSPCSVHATLRRSCNYQICRRPTMSPTTSCIDLWSSFRLMNINREEPSHLCIIHPHMDTVKRLLHISTVNVNSQLILANYV